MINHGKKARYSSCLDLLGDYVMCHDDVMKWKHFPPYWPFVRGIHRSPLNCPHKGQWCGALMFSLICVWINGWVNNREAGHLRRHRSHYDVIVIMSLQTGTWKAMRWNSACIGPSDNKFCDFGGKWHLNMISISISVSFHRQKQSIWWLWLNKHLQRFHLRLIVCEKER